MDFLRAGVTEYATAFGNLIGMSIYERRHEWHHSEHDNTKDSNNNEKIEDSKHNLTDHQAQPEWRRQTSIPHGMVWSRREMFTYTQG